MPERVQKLLARAGVASRRTAENLIRAGAVRINGRVAELGAKADPERDLIEIEGRRLRFPQEHLHLLLNKPRGVVSTASDPQGRRTVFSFLHGVRQRVFTVGRLPYDAEGLLILTSDGTLGDALLRGRLPQTYHVKIKGSLGEDERETLEKIAARHQGEPLELRRVKPGANPWYEVTLAAPREDWLRAALFRLGHPVEKMKRVGLGSLREPRLRPGQYRELSGRERERLRDEAAPRAARQRRAG